MAFEVHAGKGRMYPLSKESKQKEQDRLQGLVEQGQSWAAKAVAHDYDGYFQINQGVIDFFQHCFDKIEEKDERGSVRINWKGFKKTKNDGTPQLNIEGLWAAGGYSMGKFLSREAPASAPAGDDGFGAAPDDDFDDDIPF